MKPRSRRFLVPEVVQTSAMDCGPACLASLLSGFEIPASYDRLRELCHTSVDGTSIDEIEVTAQRLGLPVEQVMVPLDHLLLDEAKALPCILVVATPSQSTHFVVVWGRIGRWVSVMDPAAGRRFPRRSDLLDEAYIHTQSVPATAWADWARTGDFLKPLRRRLAGLGLGRPLIEEFIDAADQLDGWIGFGALDAATRMTTSLMEARALTPGPEATRLMSELLKNPEGFEESLPESWWSVRPDPEAPEGLLYRGVVLVRVLEDRLDSELQPDLHTAPSSSTPDELARVTATPPLSPVRRFLRLLRGEESSALIALGCTVALAATILIFEAVLFRALLDLHRDIGDVPQRLELFLAVVGLVGLGVILRFQSDARARQIGLRVEARLRMRLLAALPRLHHGYFRSRAVSDMAQRAHDIHHVRTAVKLGALTLRATFEILLTALAMMLLHPAMAPLTALAAILGLAIPLAAIPLQAEADLRVRTHEGSLFRSLFDSLVGLSAVRAHRAERALDQQHEGLLDGWSRSRLSLERMQIAADAAQLLVVLSSVVLVVLDYLATSPQPVDALLLAYWGLELAFRCRLAVTGIRQFTQQANTVARILEPLDCQSTQDDLPTSGSPTDDSRPVAIEFDRVEVLAGGHTILRDVNLRIEAGEHVAIVGPSGAGKTSLVNTILGWHSPRSGRLLLDGAEATAQTLPSVRQRIAWIDPTIQLWNRALLDNLRFGSEREIETSWSTLLAEAEIRGVVQSLPDGLQSPLGESGLALSGGEGQRVRLGRALLRRGVGLALLDEAFRGLGRSQRNRLLQRARKHWERATLLCVTHDVEETMAFDRVLVVDNGTIVEDGSPQELCREPSAYAALLAAERSSKERLWGRPEWRRWWIENGVLKPGTLDRVADV